MRVGLVIEEWNPEGGGAERWTARFAEHLAHAGHEVHLLAFRAQGAVRAGRLHLIPDPGSVLGRARGVTAALRPGRLPPMVWHDGGVGWSGHVLHPHTGSGLHSLQREITSHVAWRRLRATISPRLNSRRMQMRVVEHLAAARARRVIALSRHLGSFLAQRHRLPPERLRVVPNGVDNARFAPERLAPLRGPARAALGLGDETFLGLMVAHNLRLKGLDTALLALARLRAAGIDVRLAVAGGLPDRPWSGLAARLGVAEQVAFLGPVAAMEPLYAAADAMLHPTRWDACSLATIEGMAAGLPVVTTRLNGASDLIAHGSSGFVLDRPDDDSGLAETLALLLRDPARRRAIGAAARVAALRADFADNFRCIEAILAEVAQELRLDQ
ncbi:glycosyltransferase family 4 protein [Roseomonas sp. AR75]|uniref:glycosyltransferase family 4 protein n=1 Tax=Roseomonas sp. AR75 TaxID=2562311 RepID=UPI0010BF7F91|nr:glycosyltransferase family 4 protein [Roseomonas sp. AR75]